MNDKPRATRSPSEKPTAKRNRPPHATLPKYRVFFVEDVMEILGVGKSKAYDIMRRINNELKEMGFETVPGRVSEKRFYEKFYGGMPDGDPRETRKPPKGE